MMTELDEPERYVWFGFLLLAGDCAHEGRICATENSGYTDIQLADLLKTDPELIKRAKKKFLKFCKIEINENGIILICKWHLYQSEYFRQKSYRVKLQDEVTDSSPSILVSNLISFNSKEKVWLNLTEDDKRGWSEAYPACDVGVELTRMREWLIANPTKAVKSNWRRFITNWLSRSQDRGGTNRTAGKRGDDFAALDAWAAKGDKK
jgi:hypothetical protein